MTFQWVSTYQIHLLNSRYDGNGQLPESRQTGRTFDSIGRSKVAWLHQCAAMRSLEATQGHLHESKTVCYTTRERGLRYEQRTPLPNAEIHSPLRR